MLYEEIKTKMKSSYKTEGYYSAYLIPDGRFRPEWGSPRSKMFSSSTSDFFTSFFIASLLLLRIVVFHFFLVRTRTEVVFFNCSLKKNDSNV